MYSRELSWYLPTRIEDNTAYYPDGVYSVQLGSESNNRSNFLPNYTKTFTLIGPYSEGISGVRYVRNIVSRLEFDVAISLSGTDTTRGPIYFDVGLTVLRQGQSTVNSQDVLDRDSEVALIGVNQFVSRHSADFILSYPGIVKLYSGDAIAIQLNVHYDQTLPGLTYNEVVLSHVSKYDVKFA